VSSFGIEFFRNGVWQRELIFGVPMRLTTRYETRQYASTYIGFPWRIVEDSGKPNVAHQSDHPFNNYGHLEVTPDVMSA
jgi:hypothetical protein